MLSAPTFSTKVRAAVPETAETKSRRKRAIAAHY